MKGFIIGFICFLAALSLAQAQGMTDTTQSPLKFTLNLDSRQSFIKNREVSIIGGKAGIQIGKKWRTGLAYYTLYSPLNILYLDGDDTLNLQTRFQYISTYIEYVIFHGERWEISLPLQYGYGFCKFSKQTKDGSTLKEAPRQMNLGEISINGYYKVWKWIGVDAGLGYRTIFDERALLKRFFDAPIYTIKLKIFIGDFYRDVFVRKRPNK
jgi:hypothetical protein